MLHVHPRQPGECVSVSTRSTVIDAPSPTTRHRWTRRDRIILACSVVGVCLLATVVGISLWIGLAGAGDADAQDAARVIQELPNDPAAATDHVTATAADLSAFFPENMTISPRQDSWRLTGIDSGLMEVDVTGEGVEPQLYTAVLTDTDQGWRVTAFLEGMESAE